MAYTEDDVDRVARAIWACQLNIMHDHDVLWRATCKVIWMDAARAALAAMPDGRDAALEKAAKIAETMDYTVTDFGPAEPGKLFSGVCTFDNRDSIITARIAAAIRALKTPDRMKP